MTFIPYQHVEKYGSDETEGITDGVVYAFPKIDGTCSSVWMDHSNILHAASRKRELTIQNDNAGFMAWAQHHDGILRLLRARKNIILFGEWLVPHSLKTYREDAWRKFYVFDVYDTNTNRYMHYYAYQPVMEYHGIDYINPLYRLESPSDEQIYYVMSKNNYLIEDGTGVGEGIVLKNYSYNNKYGRRTWAKVITNEFKAKHIKEMGPPVIKGETLVEDKIVELFCTPSFIEKEYSKIKLELSNNNEPWTSRQIPKLLGVVWHELINEQAWNMVKKLKNPVIDYKVLIRKVTIKIKQTLPEVF